MENFTVFMEDMNYLLKIMQKMIRYDIFHDIIPSYQTHFVNMHNCKEVRKCCIFFSFTKFIWKLSKISRINENFYKNFKFATIIGDYE